MNIKPSARMMHGRDWEGDNPCGWFITEKLDGVRCFWDGNEAWTKDGNLIDMPEGIRNALPHGVMVDGELWAGRGQLEKVRCAVQYGQWAGSGVRFVAFDAPDAKGSWMERWGLLARFVPDVVECVPCEGHAHLMDTLRAIQSEGGEGLMIHDPKSRGYTPGRGRAVLKVKRVLPPL